MMKSVYAENHFGLLQYTRITFGVANIFKQLYFANKCICRDSQGWRLANQSCATNADVGYGRGMVDMHQWTLWHYLKANGRCFPVPTLVWLAVSDINYTRFGSVPLCNVYWKPPKKTVSTSNKASIQQSFNARCTVNFIPYLEMMSVCHYRQSMESQVGRFKVRLWKQSQN